MKSILAASLILAFAFSAQAGVSCGVTTESTPGQYDKSLTWKAVDNGNEFQTIYTDGDVIYGYQNSSGGWELTVFNSKTHEIFAAVLAKTQEQVTVLLPAFHNAFSCLTTPDPK